MIGLDTNVVIRFVMQDDAKQSPMATRIVDALTAEQPGYLTLVTIVEIVWVLSGSYDLERPQIAMALEGLLRAPEIVVEQAETVWQALRLFKGSKADFADCLIERSAAAAGCARTLTFDVSAAKHCGMVLAA